MTRETRCIEARLRDPLFDDQRYGLARETCTGRHAVAVDGPEHCPAFYYRYREPSLKGLHGAVPSAAMRNTDEASLTGLIGLGSPQGDNAPLSCPFEIRNIEVDQLGTPEAAGKAEQKQGTIPVVSCRGAANRIKDGEQIIPQ